MGFDINPYETEHYALNYITSILESIDDYKLIYETLELHNIKIMEHFAFKFFDEKQYDSAIQVYEKLAYKEGKFTFFFNFFKKYIFFIRKLTRLYVVYE